MKLVSWNVNGIRACVKKGFLEYFQEVNADIFCIQETKMQEGQLELNLNGYEQYWNYAEKRDIPVLLFLQNENHFQFHMGLTKMKSNRKEES